MLIDKPKRSDIQRKVIKALTASTPAFRQHTTRVAHTQHMSFGFNMIQRGSMNVPRWGSTKWTLEWKLRMNGYASSCLGVPLIVGKERVLTFACYTIGESV